MPLWAVYNKDVEKSLKKFYKNVTYISHSDCYLVISKTDKDCYGVANSKGEEEIPPFYKKIYFEKSEDKEVIIFAINPIYKAKSTGNIVHSLQRGQIMDFGNSEPQYISGGFLTSYLKPIYNLKGEKVLDCHQISIQPIRNNGEIIGYRVGSRSKNNNILTDNVLMCDYQFNLLFTLEGANYLWSITETTLDNNNRGWKCSKRIDALTSLEYLFSETGAQLTSNENGIFSDLDSSNLTSTSSISYNHNKSIENYYSEIKNQINNKKELQKPIKSDVDENIPLGNVFRPKTFALIIANEDYQEVENVPNAINDGVVFGEYCKKTFGIPSENIHFIKNATLNNIKREINLMSQISNAYSGEANFIIYYAGHGFPEESTGKSFILPVDGYTSDISTCFSLTDFYSQIGNFSSQRILIFLDACFSGSLRGVGMLQTARGVVLKAKPAKPSSNMIIFSASQSDETAYPLDKEKHGLFTYWLLKTIKESKGDITLGDLANRVRDSVIKQSLVTNGKKQTPTVQIALELKESWVNIQLNGNE